MNKYIIKNPVVEAEQWVGQEMEGIDMILPEIVMARDKKSYYITGCVPKAWLSVEKVDGMYEEYPFAFWEIKSSHEPREIATADNELVKMYMKMYNIPELKTVAYTREDGKRKDRVEIGNYLVKTSDGKMHVYTEEEFKDKYEAVK